MKPPLSFQSRDSGRVEESTVPVIPIRQSADKHPARIQHPPKELTEEESRKQFELLKEKMTRTS